jgi:hypothetical protein
MKLNRSQRIPEAGVTLIAVLATILIVSLIAANVLINCATRYNATSKQVKAWKEALYAAEAGGDVGYAECRKAITPGTEFTTAAGWTSAGTNPWTKTVPAFGLGNTLQTSVTVDKFWTDPVSGNPGYRIRATGTAKLLGLPRTGMDDRMSQTTRGDSLLRKIDFRVDHFLNTYGYGDALPSATPSVANGKSATAVANPQITRRIELIAVPVEPFDGALKCLGAFNGPGSAGIIDSYDSKNGAYPGATVATNPSHPYYSDSRNGNVAVNTPTFNQGGYIYGDVGTNGGTVTVPPAHISGTVDNAISFTAPPVAQPSPVYKPGSPSTITPSATAANPATPDWYLYSSFTSNTINALNDGAGHPVETFVNVVVTGNVGDVEIAKGVNAKIWFKGNMSVKARDLKNNNVDGPSNGVYKASAFDGVTGVPTAYAPTDNPSRAGHMQFTAISPPPGVTQTIQIQPPGDFWATFYAPDADFSVIGNPEMYGAIVCKTYSGNGNTGFHFDKALWGKAGPPVEYRIASYIEDVR